MSQDLRLYSLSVLIMLMLWTAPVRADYGVGSGCPVLAVPIQLNDDDVWHSGSEEEENWVDMRPLYPYDTTASISGQWDDNDCVVNANSGTYYDGGNHLWVLDDNLTCDFVGNEGGDFRAGDY